MIDLTSVSSGYITNIGFAFIAVIFGCFVLAEVWFTYDYQQRFKLDRNAINFLKTQRRNNLDLEQFRQQLDITPKNGDNHLFNWLRQHVYNEIQGQKLMARVENNMIVFLTWPSRLDKPVPRSPGHFVPTLLTTLGVLFTFVGVSVGLQGLSSQTSNDLTTLSEGIFPLLGGLSIAFHTSVAGMTAAVLASVVVIPIAISFRQNVRERLQKQLRAIAILETPTNLLARMNTEATQDAATQMARVAKVLSQLDMPKSKDIGDHVAAALKPTFTTISDDLKQQRQAIEDQSQAIKDQRQELLTALIGELRNEIVEPVAQRLDKSASMTHDASKAVRELKNELGGISQSLADSIQTIQTFQTNTLNDLQTFANSLEGVLTRVGVDVRDAVDQSIEGMEAQRTAFEASANKASEVMDTARESLHGTLNNIDEMLQNTRITVQEELEKFRDGYQGSLTNFFDQQNGHLSDLLDQQRQGLTAVVEDLRQVFQNDSQVMAQHINESMTKVEKTAKTVGDLVTGLGLAEGHQMAQLRQLAESMGDEAKRVESSFQSMKMQLEASFKLGNEELTDYLKKANELYSRRLEELDSDAAKVCQHLESTSDKFLIAADHLVAAAKDFNSIYSANGNGNNSSNGSSNEKVSHV